MQAKARQEEVQARDLRGGAEWRTVWQHCLQGVPGWRVRQYGERFRLRQQSLQRVPGWRLREHGEWNGLQRYGAVSEWNVQRETNLFRHRCGLHGGHGRVMLQRRLPG